MAFQSNTTPHRSSSNQTQPRKDATMPGGGFLDIVPSRRSFTHCCCLLLTPSSSKSSPWDSFSVPPSCFSPPPPPLPSVLNQLCRVSWFQVLPLQHQLRMTDVLLTRCWSWHLANVLRHPPPRHCVASSPSSSPSSDYDESSSKSMDNPIGKANLFNPRPRVLPSVQL